MSSKIIAALIGRFSDIIRVHNERKQRPINSTVAVFFDNKTQASNIYRPLYKRTRNGEDYYLLFILNDNQVIRSIMSYVCYIRV